MRKVIYFVLIFIALLGSIQCSELSCCSVTKNESQRFVYKFNFYTQRQHINLWWRIISTSFWSPKQFIRALSFMPDSVRNDVLERIKVLYELQEKIQKEFPLDKPDRSMLEHCLTLFDIDPYFVGNSKPSKDDIQATRTIPSVKPPTRRLLNDDSSSSKKRLLQESQFGVFHPFFSDYEIKFRKQNKKFEAQEFLKYTDPDYVDFVYLPYFRWTPEKYQEKQENKRQMLKMVRAMCRMGYQAHVKDLYYDAILLRNKPKYFLRHLYQISLDALKDDKQALEYMKAWISEIAVSVFRKRQFLEYIYPNLIRCDLIC